MSMNNRIGRETVRGYAPTSEKAVENVRLFQDSTTPSVHISGQAASILRGIKGPNGDSYSEMLGYEPMERNAALRCLAGQDSRLSYTRNNGNVVIKVRGEQSTPSLAEEGIGIVAALHDKFGIPLRQGARIYENFRQESEGICRKLAINGYGPMLASSAEVLAKSLVKGQDKAEDPRISAVMWTAEQYEGMVAGMVGTEGTKQSRRVGVVFGMSPKYTLAVAHIIGHENVQQICSRLSHDGYTNMIGRHPEVLIESYFEAMKIMPDHDLVEATFFVASMNYEKLAAEKNEPFVIPSGADESWEASGFDIGQHNERDFTLKVDPTEALMEHNDDGEWEGIFPLEDDADDRRDRRMQMRLMHQMARPEEIRHLDDVVNF